MTGWCIIGPAVEQFISTWGYLAVFLLVGAESFGIPAPGETALIAAAILAAKGHLSFALVLAAAVAGGIIGDNAGYWVGRRVGYPLLCRYGQYVRMPPERLKLLQYLFLRYGKRIVFVGRFISVLRAWEAFLAGADLMAWRAFALTNAAAVVVWAVVWGCSAYWLGHSSMRTIEWVSGTVSVLVFVGVVYAWWYFRQHEGALEEQADAALPGPLRPRHRG